MPPAQTESSGAFLEEVHSKRRIDFVFDTRALRTIRRAALAKEIGEHQEVLHVHSGRTETRTVSLGRLDPPRALVMGFAAAILLGTVLLMLPYATVDGQGARFIDALFTATSAICVTGLVVKDTGTYFTQFGQVVILVLIQIGGLGITASSMLAFILLGKRITLRERILIQEALNQVTLRGLVRLLLYIAVVTLIAEAAGAVILVLRWANGLGWAKALYMGAFHAVSAFNNSGFDLMGEFRSLTGFVEDATITLTIAGLAILGGLGFSVIADLQHSRKPRDWSLNTKVVLTVTGVLLLAGTILIFLMEYSNNATLGALSWKGKLLASFFQAVTPRTSGFNTLFIQDMRFSSLVILMILMFIGTASGGTGGGTKIGTFTVLVASVWATVRGHEEPAVYGRRLPRDTVDRALAVTMIALSLVTAVTIVLSITERNFSFMQMLFETVSAFGTVGLSTGITPELSDPGRILVVITMFAGRVGPLTVAIALAKRQKRVGVRFPEEKVLIG